MKKSELRQIIKEELIKENAHLPKEFKLLDELKDHHDGLVDIISQIEYHAVDKRWQTAAKFLMNDLNRLYDDAFRYSKQLGNIKIK